MSLYPVAIITYNRVKHTKHTIEALAQNSLAKDTDVYIFSDAPKKESDQESVKLLREYLDSVANLTYFKSVTVIKAVQNEHVTKATLKAGNMLLEHHDAFIGLEDDIQTHPYFLQYMNDTLNYYKNRKDIMAVVAYAHDTSFKWAFRASFYKKELVLSYAFHSYGWGIWKDRWQDIDWKIQDYKQSYKGLLKKIKANILSWNHLLAIKKEHNNPTNELWDIRFSYNMFSQNKACIWPKQSYTSNIGFDGSGFHQWTFHPRFFENSMKNLKEHITLDPNLKLSFFLSLCITTAISIKWIIAFLDLFLRKIGSFFWRMISLKFMFKK